MDFVDEWFTLSMQEQIYSGFFCGIETHDMPVVGDYGIVRSMSGEVVFLLDPPTKRSPDRPKKKRMKSQFQDKSIIYCSKCNMSRYNHKTCNNPLP